MAIKTVYVTADPTFTGKVGGYSTQGKSKATKAAEKNDEATTTKKAAAHTTAAPKATTTAKAVRETTTKEAAKTKEDESSKEETESTTKASEKDIKTTMTTKAHAETTSTDDSSTIPSSIDDPTDSDTDTVLAKATDQVTSSSAVHSGTVASISATESTASSSATSEASTSSSSSGSSAGAKAGIAFGVLGGLFLVGLLVFLLFSRRRKQLERQRLEEDDEKLHGPIGGGGVFAAAAVRDQPSPSPPPSPEPQMPRTDPKAPRISLRPVTQFLPNWNGLEKRTSKGATLALSVPAAGTGAPVTSRAPGGSAWERPSTAQSADPSNPFGVQAERVPTPVMEEREQAHSSAPSPVTDQNSVRAVSPISARAESPVVAEAAAVTVATGVGAAALARKASIRKDLPKPLDLTLPNPPLAAVPASPAGTEFSVSSAAPGAPEPASSGAAAIAAAGGPVNSSVHRVQLDFKRTLDDELDLNAGELVRLLHEYDDGWVSDVSHHVLFACINV